MPKEPYMMSKEPYQHTPSGLCSDREPCIRPVLSQKSPVWGSKEPHVMPKEPYIMPKSHINTHRVVSWATVSFFRSMSASVRSCIARCVTWLVHMRDMTHTYARHGWFICVTWLIHMCDMTRSYVWHDLSIFWSISASVRSCIARCVTWLVHVCDMTHSCVWHDSFMCVTWLIHMCDT